MMNEQSLAKKQDADIATQVPADPFVSMAQDMLKGDTDVERFERIWQMVKEREAVLAERKFNAAMSEAQAKMRNVRADATNPQTRSKYATYAALDRALRPIYTEDGFSLSFDTGEAQNTEEVRVVCHVSHSAGHTRDYHADMPADGKGAKGNAVMTRTHATGSAMSYGMRYLLKMIFNVAVGEDDDGNTASSPALDEGQIQKLEALIKEVGADKEAFLKFCRFSFGAGELSQIRQKDFQRAVDALNAKKKAKK